MRHPSSTTTKFLKCAALLTLFASLTKLILTLFSLARIFAPMHAGIALTQTEVLEAVHGDGAKKVIPAITHQIWHDWSGEGVMPDDWAESRRSCVEGNEGWEHMLWTDNSSRQFLADEYPHFLPLYDGFTLRVQRIDALRYFLMRHFGGVYIDLDNGCVEPLEPLRYYQTFVTDGGHGALSNNILGAAPSHPFWVLLTDSIPRYAWTYPLPYLTVSYATGQWFETDIWELYHAALPEDQKPLLRVMMDGRPGAAKWVFWDQRRGGTWVAWDNAWFTWIGQGLNAVWVGLGIVGIMLMVGGLGTCFRRGRQKRRAGKMGEKDDEIEKEALLDEEGEA